MGAEGFVYTERENIMTEIESPLGRKVYSSTTPQRRVLTVPEEDPSLTQGGTFYQPPQQRQAVKMSIEEMEEIEEMRNRAVERQTRVSPEARNRLEFLSGIGRMEESVTIENTKFTLQSMKSGEQEEVFESISGFNNASAIKIQFEIRAQTLARVIYAIDDQLFSIVIGSNHMKDKVAATRLLDENVADHLYKWYQENIVKKAQDKYAVKTEKDAEEVIEAIKK